MTDAVMPESGDKPVRTYSAKNFVPETALIKYRSQRTLTLVFVMMAVMLHTIDSTIANVALPHMQGSLSANVEQISWVITGYIMATAAATPLIAWLAERYGVKRILIIATLSFTATSALCGLAISVGDVVLYRILQGLSGAALIPLGQMVLLSTFDRTDMARAMAVFGFGVMLGPIIAPTLGGYLTEYFNWRWVFFINVPIGLISAMGMSLLVKERATNDKLPLEITSAVSLVLAIACLQFMLDRGQGKGWFDSWEIMSLGLAAFICFYIFVVRTIYGEKPLFPRELFLDRNFLLGSVLFFFMMGTMIALMLMLPTLMQSIMGYPVLKTGWILVPRGVGMMIGMAAMPRLAASIDGRVMASIGMGIAAYAMWEQSRVSIYFTEWDFMRLGFLHGLGLGTAFVQMTAISFSTVPDRLRLDATSVFSIFRNTGSALCASIAITIGTRSTQVNTAEIGERVSVLRKALELPKAGLLEAGNEQVMLAIIQADIYRQAALISYVNSFNALAIISVLCVPLFFFIRIPTEEDIANARL